MSVPTPEDLEAKKLALLERSLTFLRRSTVDLVDSPADSVIHFAAGMELLLKTRLFAEHWTLILKKPHGYEWHNLWTHGEDGNPITIAASEIIDAVGKVTGVQLSRLRGPFDSIRKLRNKAMHLLIHEEDRPLIAAAQWSCWHQAYLLISREWSCALGNDFVEKARSLDEELIQSNRPYVEARFRDLQEVGSYKRAKNRGLLAVCPECGQESALLERCAGSGLFAKSKCPPCLSEGMWMAEKAEPQARTWIPLSKMVHVICPYCDSYPSVYQVDEGGRRFICTSCGETVNIVECGFCGGDWAEKHDYELSYTTCGRCDNIPRAPLDL